MEFWEIDTNTVALKLFGEIGRWYRSADEFQTVFNQLERKYSTIIMKVHCPGGSVFDANVIYNIINQSKATVIYEIVGLSASMSSILQTGAAKVRICENAFVMIHRPSGGADGSADDIFSVAKLLKSMETNFVKRYKGKTKKSEAEIWKLFDGTDHWFSAEEALAWGLVDEIIPAVVKDLNSLNKPANEQQANEMYLQFAANLQTEIPVPDTNIQNENQSTFMKELIIAMFGLIDLNKDSSDTTIVTAALAKLTAAENANAVLQAKYTALEGGQLEVLIAATETRLGKPFETDKKASLQAIGKENIAALKMALSFMEPTPAADAPVATVPGAAPAPAAAAPAAVNLITGVKANGTIIPERASWNWQTWCEKDEPGLLALSEEERGKIYKATYKVDMPKD